MRQKATLPRQSNTDTDREDQFPEEGGANMARGQISDAPGKHLESCNFWYRDKSEKTFRR